MAPLKMLQVYRTPSARLIPVPARVTVRPLLIPRSFIVPHFRDAVSRCPVVPPPNALSDLPVGTDSNIEHAVCGGKESKKQLDTLSAIS